MKADIKKVYINDFCDFVNVYNNTIDGIIHQFKQQSKMNRRLAMIALAGAVHLYILEKRHREEIEMLKQEIEEMKMKGE